MPPALTATLELAVPMWMLELKDVPFEQRQRLAAEAGQVIACQGDTLQYGSKIQFGHGTREKAAHDGRPSCTVKDCPCGGKGCAETKCWCHRTGNPAYSAGEVFNHLARGLAVLAFQPGGVTFAGMHWCADHAECEAAQASARDHAPDGADGEPGMPK